MQGVLILKIKVLQLYVSLNWIELMKNIILRQSVSVIYAYP